ncbi:undecaprenyl-diphosphate phosphatase [Bacteroidota bacterium]
MGVVEAIILGIVQGLTEFLPISSSGHVELGSALLGIQTSENLLFLIIVHSATALSTIVVYRKDISSILSGLLKFEKNDSWDFTFKILISAIPVFIIGVFFKEEVESFFGGRVGLVGSMLIITSVLLAFTYFAKERAGKISYFKSLLIGISQALAVLPGISRSGATISTALLSGVKREEATRFSFLMVLLPIIGASLLDIMDIIQNPESRIGISFITLISGFIAAFVTGIIACRWMIKIVKKGKLIYFSIYCLIIGLIALISTL